MASKRNTLIRTDGGAAPPGKDSEARQRLIEAYPALDIAGASPEALADAAGLTTDELATMLQDPQLKKQLEVAAEKAVAGGLTLPTAAAVFLHGFLARANERARDGTLDPDEEQATARISVKLLERDDRVKAAAADPYADLPMINFTISDSLKPGWTPPPGYVEVERPRMTIEIIDPGKPAPAPRTEASGLCAMNALLSGDFEPLPLDGEGAQ